MSNEEEKEEVVEETQSVRGWVQRAYTLAREGKVKEAARAAVVAEHLAAAAGGGGGGRFALRAPRLRKWLQESDKEAVNREEEVTRALDSVQDKEALQSTLVVEDAEDEVAVAWQEAHVLACVERRRDMYGAAGVYSVAHCARQLQTAVWHSEELRVLFLRELALQRGSVLPVSVVATAVQAVQVYTDQLYRVRVRGKGHTFLEALEEAGLKRTSLTALVDALKILTSAAVYARRMQASEAVGMCIHVDCEAAAWDKGDGEEDGTDDATAWVESWAVHGPGLLETLLALSRCPAATVLMVSHSVLCAGAVSGLVHEKWAACELLCTQLGRAATLHEASLQYACAGSGLFLSGVEGEAHTQLGLEVHTALLQVLEEHTSPTDTQMHTRGLLLHHIYTHVGQQLAYVSDIHKLLDGKVQLAPWVHTLVAHNTQHTPRIAKQTHNAPRLWHARWYAVSGLLHGIHSELQDPVEVGASHLSDLADVDHVRALWDGNSDVMRRYASMDIYGLFAGHMQALVEWVECTGDASMRLSLGLALGQCIGCVHTSDRPALMCVLRDCLLMDVCDMSWLWEVQLSEDEKEWHTHVARTVSHPLVKQVYAMTRALAAAFAAEPVDEEARGHVLDSLELLAEVHFEAHRSKAEATRAMASAHRSLWWQLGVVVTCHLVNIVQDVCSSQQRRQCLRILLAMAYARRMAGTRGSSGVRTAVHALCDEQGQHGVMLTVMDLLTRVPDAGDEAEATTERIDAHLHALSSALKRVHVWQWPTEAVHTVQDAVMSRLLPLVESVNAMRVPRVVGVWRAVMQSQLLRGMADGGETCTRVVARLLDDVSMTDAAALLHDAAACQHEAVDALLGAVEERGATGMLCTMAMLGSVPEERVQDVWHTVVGQIKGMPTDELRTAAVNTLWQVINGMDGKRRARVGGLVLEAGDLVAAQDEPEHLSNEE